MTISAPTPVGASPNCEAHLDLVDKAFQYPAGAAAQFLASRLCPPCPVAADCLAFALANGEHGPWGGTTRKRRSAGRGWKPAENLKDVHPRSSPRLMAP